MRKIILDVAVSLDGLIEGPGGEYDWCFCDQDYGFNDFLRTVDTVFYGRKSYELFGDEISGKKKYVFSRTRRSGGTEATFIRDNIVKEVNKIKRQPGKNIYLYGGASLLTSLMKAGLVDEFRLFVHPIILGSGKPLFSDLKKRTPLKLVNKKVFSSGLIFLHYKRLPADSKASK